MEKLYLVSIKTVNSLILVGTLNQLSLLENFVAWYKCNS